MKKFKIFIVGILCAICICPLAAGCSAGSYVANSFKYRVEYNTVYNDHLVSYQFMVKLPKEGDYAVEYTLWIKDSSGNVIDKSNKTYDISSNGATSYRCMDKQYVFTSSTSLVASISDVKIKKVDNKEDSGNYKALAIGFGVLGINLLGTVIALFVIDQKGKKKN